MIWLGVSGATLLVLTFAGLSLHDPGAITLPSLGVTQVFVGLLALAACVYFAAVTLVLRRVPEQRHAVWLVIGVALAMRSAVLFAPPFLSSDVFRYVWDGKVQVAGINPYRYLPANPALAPLRDAAIYPHINRADYAPTIYPPAAQLIFRLAAWISPSVLAMKCVMVAFELLAILAMLRVLQLAGLPRARVLIYAWNPLAVWAFAGNGHVDAAAIGFIGLALLARGTRHELLAGTLLGGAVLVKFLPAAIAPALWRRGDWRLPVACAAVIVALYGVYLGVGWRVLGFLPGYAGEEGISAGGGFWLLAGLREIVPLPDSAVTVYLGIAALVLMALAVWIALWQRPVADPANDIVRVCRGAAILAAATMVLLSPHYAWYFVWLALPCCVSPLRSVIYLSAAGLLLYVNPLDEHFLWPSLVFVPALVLGVLDFRESRTPRIAAPIGAIERSP